MGAQDESQARNAVDNDARLSAPATPDARQRALAIGLEVSKRCFEAPTAEDLYLLLTHDVRSVLEFDRSILILHMGGVSQVASVSNLPVPDKRSQFHELAQSIVEPLRDLRKAALLSKSSGAASFSDEDLPQNVREALQSYLDFSGCSYLLCIPLIHNTITTGHLIFEIFDAQAPNQINILTVLNMAPLMAAALAEKWLLAKKPRLLSLIDPERSPAERANRAKKRLRALAAGALIALLLLFAVPFPFDVGGEAEIMPIERHAAFCKIEGLIDRVNVVEGQRVQEDEVLATLDPREIDYRIRSAETQFEVLTAELKLLRASGGEDPAKLAESKIIELKRKAAWGEAQFYKWQAQFLAIKAPVTGTVLTKEIDSLAGKKFRAGEAFCEIAAQGEMAAQVLVPEDRISYVAPDQEVTLYLSNSPRKGYALKVRKIAPMAEAIPRLGNVYRVTAPFPDAPASTYVGMKGIGKIHIMRSSLWFIITDRLLSRLQKWSLYI